MEKKCDSLELKVNLNLNQLVASTQGFRIWEGQICNLISTGRSSLETGGFVYLRCFDHGGIHLTPFIINGFEIYRFLQILEDI